MSLPNLSSLRNDNLERVSGAMLSAPAPQAPEPAPVGTLQGVNILGETAVDHTFREVGEIIVKALLEGMDTVSICAAMTKYCATSQSACADPQGNMIFKVALAALGFNTDVKIAQLVQLYRQQRADNHEYDLTIDLPAQGASNRLVFDALCNWLHVWVRRAANMKTSQFRTRWQSIDRNGPWDESTMKPLVKAEAMHDARFRVSCLVVKSMPGHPLYRHRKAAAARVLASSTQMWAPMRRAEWGCAHLQAIAALTYDGTTVQGNGMSSATARYLWEEAARLPWNVHYSHTVCDETVVARLRAYAAAHPGEEVPTDYNNLRALAKTIFQEIETSPVTWGDKVRRDRYSPLTMVPVLRLSAVAGYKPTVPSVDQNGVPVYQVFMGAITGWMIDRIRSLYSQVVNGQAATTWLEHPFGTETDIKYTILQCPAPWAAGCPYTPSQMWEQMQRISVYVYTETGKPDDQLELPEDERRTRPPSHDGGRNYYLPLTKMLGVLWNDPRFTDRRTISEFFRSLVEGPARDQIVLNAEEAARYTNDRFVATFIYQHCAWYNTYIYEKMRQTYEFDGCGWATLGAVQAAVRSSLRTVDPITLQPPPQQSSIHEFVNNNWGRIAIVNDKLLTNMEREIGVPHGTLDANRAEVMQIIIVEQLLHRNADQAMAVDG
jgi:hypothetical protein